MCATEAYCLLHRGVRNKEPEGPVVAHGRCDRSPAIDLCWSECFESLYLNNVFNKQSILVTKNNVGPYFLRSAHETERVMVPTVRVRHMTDRLLRDRVDDPVVECGEWAVGDHGHYW